MPSRQEQIQAHIEQDSFANFLGAKVEEIRPGYSRVSLVIRPNHHNFHGMTHGGLVFSLGDIAFAAASNSRGQIAVALDVTISFLKATYAGNHLVAECTEQSLNGPIGLYEIVVKDKESAELISKSQATVYRKKQMFIDSE